MSTNEIQQPETAATPALERPKDIEYVTFKTDVQMLPGSKTFRFIATTAAQDRMGDRIPVEGWDMTSFLKAPRVLWAHDYHSLPIGKALRIGVENVNNAPAWVADVEFVPGEVYQKAGQVQWMAEHGFLNTVSVGFRSLDSAWIEESEEETKKRKSEQPDVVPGKTFKRKELLELSLVPVPANPEALLLEVQRGMSVPDEVQKELQWWQSKEVVANTREIKERLRKLQEGAETKAVEPEPTPEPIPEVKTEAPVEEPIERGAIGYQKTPKAPEGEAWDAGAEVKKASGNAAKLRKMHAWVDSGAENFDASERTWYKLPHHKGDGDQAVVWRGVAAAMAAVMGSRGGVDIPESDKAGVRTHLSRHYAEFEKEVPKSFEEAEKEEKEQVEITVSAIDPQSVAKQIAEKKEELRELFKKSVSDPVVEEILRLAAEIEKAWEETENEIRHRVKDPALFKKDSFRTVELKKSKPTINAIMGKLLRQDVLSIQALRFPKAEWTLAEAKKWVADHPDISKFIDSFLAETMDENTDDINFENFLVGEGAEDAQPVVAIADSQPAAVIAETSSAPPPATSDMASQPQPTTNDSNINNSAAKEAASMTEQLKTETPPAVETPKADPNMAEFTSTMKQLVDAIKDLKAPPPKIVMPPTIDGKEEIREAQARLASFYPITVTDPETHEQRTLAYKSSRKNWGEMPPKNEFSFLRFLMAQRTGKWDEAGFEKEAMQEADRYATTRAIAWANGSAGGYWIPPEFLPQEFYLQYVAALVVRRAGCRVLACKSAAVNIPRISANGTAYWLPQNTTVTESAPTPNTLQLTPKWCCARTQISRFLADTDPGVAEQYIRDELVQRLSLAADLAALDGHGTSGQPTGLMRTGSIGEVVIGTNAGALLPSHLFSMLYDLELHNVPTDMASCGWIFHPRTWNAFRQKTISAAATYNYLLWQNAPFGIAQPQLWQLMGYPVYTTTAPGIAHTHGNVTTCGRVLLANFKDVLWAEWGGMALEATREGGNAFIQHAVEFKAVLAMDIGVKDPNAIAICDTSS